MQISAYNADFPDRALNELCRRLGQFKKADVLDALSKMCAPPAVDALKLSLEPYVSGLAADRVCSARLARRAARVVSRASIRKREIERRRRLAQRNGAAQGGLKAAAAWSGGALRVLAAP